MWERFWNERNRTLLLLIPKEKFAQQTNITNSFPHVFTIDWQHEFLNTVIPNQKKLNLTVQNELDRLKDWSNKRVGNVISIINTEYLLTYFNINQRQLFWRA